MESAMDADEMLTSLKSSFVNLQHNNCQCNNNTKNNNHHHFTAIIQITLR